MSRREKKKNKKVIIIQIILIVVVAFSIYKICSIIIKNNTKSLKDRINAYVTQNGDATEIDFNGLKKMNSDTVAYFKLEALGIEYPIVKTDNNSYYIYHNFDKKEDIEGCLFADYRCKVNGLDKNLIIYGNNCENGEMFGKLKKILRPELYEDGNIPVIKVITEKETMKYEVFSAYEISVEDYYLTTEFSSKGYENFLNVIKSMSLKKFDVKLDESDDVITLATCANSDKYRIVVHARRIQ